MRKQIISLGLGFNVALIIINWIGIKPHPITLVLATIGAIGAFLANLSLDNYMKKNEYKCDACGNIYEYGWSDKEAKKEYENLWTKEEKQQPTSIICNDCFQKGMTKHFRHRN